jgi:hypothetical protein
MVKTMVKSLNQQLKRMRKRHPLLIAVGLPIVVTDSGCHVISIESGKKYDLRNKAIALYLGGEPESVKQHAFNLNPQIGGKSFYIEKISSIDVSRTQKKIEYRILTDRWN